MSSGEPSESLGTPGETLRRDPERASRRCFNGSARAPAAQVEPRVGGGPLGRPQDGGLREERGSGGGAEEVRGTMSGAEDRRAGRGSRGRRRRERETASRVSGRRRTSGGAERDRGRLHGVAQAPESVRQAQGAAAPHAHHGLPGARVPSDRQGSTRVPKGLTPSPRLSLEISLFRGSREVSPHDAQRVSPQKLRALVSSESLSRGGPTRDSSRDAITSLRGLEKGGISRLNRASERAIATPERGRYTLVRPRRTRSRWN